MATVNDPNKFKNQKRKEEKEERGGETHPFNVA